METVITPDMWEQKEDGLWYVSIDFECDPELDTVMEFTDDSSYMEEHKEDFDLLNNGESDGKKCTISADRQPSCDMKIHIKTVEEAGGRVVYDKKGNPEYLPPEQPSFNFGSMFGDMAFPPMTNENGNQIDLASMVPENIVDAEVSVVNEETAEGD